MQPAHAPFDALRSLAPVTRRLLVAAAALTFLLAGPATAAEPETVTGTIWEEVIDEAIGESSHSQYVLFDDTSPRRYVVSFEDPEIAPSFVSGSRATLTGVIDDEASTLTLQADAPAPAAAIAKAGTTTAKLRSARDVLVIRVNMTGPPNTGATVGCSASSIDSLMFGTNTFVSVYGFYREASFAQTSLQGDVINVTIPSTLAPCTTANRYQWTFEADTAAAGQGYNGANYDHIVYVLADGVNCPFAGIAIQGGKWSWIDGCNDPHVYAHELGHNLGLGHAAAIWDGDCLLYEYLDRSDAMGLAYHKFNAPHLEQAGWMPQAKIQPVTASGIYTIDALHRPIAAGTHPRVLTIADPTAGPDIYLSLRDPSGPYDFGMTSDIAHKLSVHRFDPPNSTTSLRRTRLVETLGVGGSYWAVGDNVKIRLLADYGDHADVEVTIHNCYFANPPCVPPPSPGSPGHC